MSQSITTAATQFFEQINSYLSKKDRVSVQMAFAIARRAHGKQRRKSGELFFIHPIEVALFLAEYHLDAPALMAALLHDVAEDTRVSLKDIRKEFGKEVARLVDAVTKLGDASSNGELVKATAVEIQDATLHKLFRAMTQDVRAVIIKMFDRLHNLQTIKAMPPHKQVQKAKETLSIYAPLANRLGIWRLKNELEALSLEVLDAKAYYTIKRRLEEIEKNHQEMFQNISAEIFDCLLQAGLGVQNVVPAPENIYTIYQDLNKTGKSYEMVDETFRLVVLMEDWMSCYQALGLLHQLWPPVPGNFDDYIAVPRDNLYRSLHTTVTHSSGYQIKLRFRTVVMDQVSNIGVMARWLYAGSKMWSDEIAERVNSFLENISENIEVEPHNLSEGVKGVVEDVFRKQIRVSTPLGKMVQLAQNATPIDFAYAIHTGLGNRCSSALVNELLYPLNRPLKDGDRVRIVKRHNAEPQRAWLDEDLGFLQTNYARTNVRKWFRHLPDETAVAQGQNLLQEELNMLALADYPHEEIARYFHFEQVTALYHALGRAELLPTSVSTRVLEQSWNASNTRSLDSRVRNKEGEEFIIMNADGRSLRLCNVCHPQPRDSIIGFLRNDGGVTVHKDNCLRLQPERLTGRLLKIGWGGSSRRARAVTIQVDVHDRTGLLFEIAQLMEKEQINITYIHTPKNSRKGEIRLVFTLQVVQPRQLVRILHQIKALYNVYLVQCLTQEPKEHPKDISYNYTLE